MKMFRWGIEGGRPAPGSIGTRSGVVLQRHGDNAARTWRSRSRFPLTPRTAARKRRSRAFIVIAPDGQPRRVGMASRQRIFGSSFRKERTISTWPARSFAPARSDQNSCVDPDFESVPVEVKIERGGKSALVENLPQRRSGNVPQPGEHRTSSFQVRSPSPSGGRSRSFLRNRLPELQRWHQLAGWRCDAGFDRRLWPALAQSGAVARSQAGTSQREVLWGENTCQNRV